ncbi:hypothetical protein [Tsukamurella paurometabola]|uniref:Uncharacterized protein n=1 Tax=Tsukamurella paurometabola TaxID=2061 RepID=A0A3P8KN36_TSUPA|nr:hypothetical protein [Tsukamurella paurometabola]UEA84794.1 hypothetical protein LK411_08240 [Tsukamurella paurometabola]VDR37377.1 Uncharacterised protein [Tsukamurella paurometabola]
MSAVEIAALAWLAGWAVYAAVKVDAALRPGVVRVGCNGAAGSSGRTVCISTLGVGLEALCVCSKRTDDPENAVLEAVPTDFHTASKSSRVS